MPLFYILFAFAFLFPAATHVSRESATVVAPSDFLFDKLNADGFDYPVGNADGQGSYTSNGKTYNGWYLATRTGDNYPLGIHTGEDWNGVGGGNTDLGQPVFSTATGKVLAAADYGSPWGNVIMIAHVFIENAKRETVYSLYAHLEKMYVSKGQLIARRQKIGSIGTGNGAYPAHLHFEIRKSLMSDYEVTYWPSSHDKDVAWVLKHYEKPSEFVKAHRRILLPSSEEELLVAVKHHYKMFHYKKGICVHTYEIALSQQPTGHKEKQGDNRLPEGAYDIIQKTKGPFSGAYSEYFGPAWFRISYPNRYDAAAALNKGLISKAAFEKIRIAHQNKTEPPKSTALGGGIGIHGWAGEWSNEDPRHLTWGCISMHNKDLAALYEVLKIPTPILILP